MQETTTTENSGNGDRVQEVMAGIAERAAVPVVTMPGALGELMETIEAIPPEQVRKLGVSVPQAVAVGRHYARCYAEDRGQFARALNPCVFDPGHYDDMFMRSEALWEADVLLEKSMESNDDVSSTAESARGVKRRLTRVAEYLWGEDEDKMERLSSARSGYSHMDLADSVFTLYHLFKENWEEVERRSDVTGQELDNAHALGNRLLDAIGPSRDGKVKEAQDLRDRAAEYLRRGIEDLRTAAGFVFRNDETHLVRYPSLGSLRRRRRTDASNGVNRAEEQPATEIESDPIALDLPSQAV